jgi:hypothetical protein
VTLVVAQRIHGRIHIVADAALTPADGRMRRAFLGGTLKAVILSPRLCVCFAGAVGVATRTIRALAAQRPSSGVDAARALISSAKGDLAAIDFLVAAFDPAATLIAVKDGRLQAGLDRVWIGSTPAFAAFQRAINAALPPTVVDLASQPHARQMNELSEIVGRDSLAIEAVIGDQAVEEVGDFAVSVSGSASRGFTYGQQGVIYGEREMTIPPGQWTPSWSGGAEEGGFAYSVLVPRDSGVGAIGVHIEQANLGLLYAPLISGEEALPIVFKDLDASDFERAVERKFKIRLHGPHVRPGRPPMDQSPSD